jgi:hypothetical protein
MLVYLSSIFPAEKIYLPPLSDSLLKLQSCFSPVAAAFCTHLQDGEVGMSYFLGSFSLHYFL